MLWQISVRYLVTHQRQTIICVAGVTISRVPHSIAQRAVCEQT